MRERTWKRARLWSRRVRAEKFSLGRSGAQLCAMRQLVLAGLPTTKTLTLREAHWLRAAPCSRKIEAFFSRRSLRSMPGRRGKAPTIRQ